jgi:hypothetical protein
VVAGDILRICLAKIFMIKSRDDFHFLTLSEVDQFMYPSDLTDAEWKRIAHHFQPKDRRGSGCKHEKKHIMFSSALLGSATPDG